MQALIPIVIGLVTTALVGFGGLTLFQARQGGEVAAAVETRVIGTVVSAGATELTVAVLQYDGPVPTDGGTKTFTITDTTKVWRQEQRDFALFQQEYAVFTEAIAAGTTTPMQAPLPYTEVHMTLDDIAADAGVIITPTEAGSAIATEVLVTPPQQAAQPAPVPQPAAQGPVEPPQL